MSQIRFEYKDNVYTIEYTRKAVEQIERSGFDRDQIETKSTIMIPLLWTGGLSTHHPTLKRSEAMKIYDEMNNKQDLILALLEMFEESRSTLLDSGNVSWTRT